MGTDYSSDTATGAELVDDQAVDVIEIAGSIKWFDVAKGYGFIVPDDSKLPDILLHVTCLRRDGFQTAYEGSRVVCEVLARPKGLQALRILSLDESTALHPAQTSTNQHLDIEAEGGFEDAVVKWFNRVRGFGFLTQGEGTPDIFVHMETLRRFGIAELRPGQQVQVKFGPSGKGSMAVEVRPVGGGGSPSSH
jgi:CspA family cold shock protein